MSALPFAARLATVMFAVVLAASTLTVALNTLKFRKVLRAQDDLVYSFVAADLRDTVEDSLNLGLPLAALQSTQNLLQRRRASENRIIGITVFDSNDVVLFDTDQFRVGSKIPLEWRPEEAKTWSADLPDAILTAAAITSNFGESAGGVVVRYDPRATDARMIAVLLSMVRAALPMLAAVAAAAALAGFALTRPYRRWLAQVSARAAMAGSGPPSAAALTARGEGGETGKPVEMMSAIRRTSAALDRAEHDLLRLGTEDDRAA